MLKQLVSLNKYFAKIFIVGFILLNIFGEAGLKYDNKGDFLFTNNKETVQDNEEVVDSTTDYSKPIANKFSRVALAANGLNNNILTDVLPGNNNESKDVVTANDGSRLVVFDNNSILPDNGFQEPITGPDQIINYTVEEGDSPASIADSFGITTDTILWANNLKSGDYIRSGDVLRILPISGVEHKVTNKDTITSIADKYQAKAEDIIVYNSLPASGDIKPGDDLIIPNGIMPAPPKPKVKPKPVVVVDNNHDENVWVNPFDKNHPPEHSHKFPWGQCTYWVAKNRYVPWGGDAKNWLRNAQAYGYEIGSIPVKGAIVITTENRRYGHAALVEEVGDGTITVSEMNFKGLGIKSVRILSANSKVIRGYIY